MKTYLKTALILGLSALSTTAWAIPVNYQYASTVDASSIGLGASEAVTFNYSLDTATPDQNGASGLGQYTLTSLAISVGGFTTTLANPGYPRGIVLMSENNALDAYGVNAYNGGPTFSGTINGFQLLGGAFTLSDLGTSNWNSDALVTNLTVLNNLGYSSLSLDFIGATVRHPGQFGGSFTTTDFTISQVPEPGLADLASCF